MKNLMELVDDWTKSHTKAALAKALGCSGVTLNNKLSGATELSFSEAEALAKALGVTLEAISQALHAGESVPGEVA